MKSIQSIKIDFNDKTSENIITDKLSEIKDYGQDEINLEIRSKSNQEVKRMILNVRLFTKIKEIQDLPDGVIVKLLLSEGKLASSDFKVRILNG